jgi:hypothetical protein
MDQFKFSIGPYELFSSTIAGTPILFAIFLLYRPIESLRDIVSVIRDNSSLSIAVTLVITSYILGGLCTAITWKYFLYICKIFKIDYSYLGMKILEKMKKIDALPADVRLEALDFEDRLIYLLIQKIGIVKRLSLLDARLISYLRLHSLQTVSIAESHLAFHIMYRTLSFGFLLLALVLFTNIFRTGIFTLEQITLPLFSIILSLAAFRMAVSFRKWRNREIVLCFYHLAYKESLSNGSKSIKGIEVQV